MFAGLLLQKIRVPDCGACKNTLSASKVTSNSKSFKEGGSDIKFASDNVMLQVENFHTF